MSHNPEIWLGALSTLALYSIPTSYVAAKGLVFKAYPDEIPRFWEMRWK